LFFASFILRGASNLGAQSPHSDPQNTGKWILNQEVSNGFNTGSLDPKKWWIQGADNHYKNR